MTSPIPRSGNEPQLNKDTTPEIERWHQADVLFQQAQLCLARGERTEAADLLRQATDTSPDHQQAARILAAMEATPSFTMSDPVPVIDNYWAAQPVVPQPIDNPITSNALLGMYALMYASTGLAGATLHAFVVDAFLRSIGLSDLLKGSVGWLIYVWVCGLMFGCFTGMMSFTLMAQRRTWIRFVASTLISIVSGFLTPLFFPILLIAALAYLYRARWMPYMRFHWR